MYGPGKEVLGQLAKAQQAQQAQPLAPLPLLQPIAGQPLAPQLPGQPPPHPPTPSAVPPPLEQQAFHWTWHQDSRRWRFGPTAADCDVRDGR